MQAEPELKPGGDEPELNPAAADSGPAVHTGEPELQPITDETVLNGFGNLLRKELSLWWGTYRWLWQVLLWVVILNGITFAVLYSAKAYPHDNAEPFELAVQAFFTVAALGTAVGAIVAAQDALIGERQLGTAAWILAKPVSRGAFVLTKFCAQGLSLTMLSVLIPGLGLMAEVHSFLGVTPAVAPLLRGLLVLALNLLYYQAMMLMLATFFHTRGGATGCALGFMFVGEILPGLAPKLMAIGPWSFGDIANALALKMVIPGQLIVPVWVSALTIPIFLTIALGRFAREEL